MSPVQPCFVAHSSPSLGLPSSFCRLSRAMRIKAAAARTGLRVAQNKVSDDDGYSSRIVEDAEEQQMVMTRVLRKIDGSRDVRTSNLYDQQQLRLNNISIADIMNRAISKVETREGLPPRSSPLQLERPPDLQQQISGKHIDQSVEIFFSAFWDILNPLLPSLSSLIARLVYEIAYVWNRVDLNVKAVSVSVLDSGLVDGQVKVELMKHFPFESNQLLEGKFVAGPNKGMDLFISVSTTDQLRTNNATVSKHQVFSVLSAQQPSNLSIPYVDHVQYGGLHWYLFRYASSLRRYKSLTELIQECYAGNMLN
ncbi:hypothetical protein GUITHDRAFT_106532 [Guillardia theta CCMP2712]|uniref:Uncharacterized protein n=2 Tax=Guillardia theta TaxID=55529 RepID=L1JHH0_GUITC|nr:hypothetical protein GUITHDRAFT_106532 [Guillardia theta CCMP2712]EKX47545.1 hypothetical protein GUITHDRAFT_106532 [Guillardia theta CCMP2712]|eukprot:XP_005834525.1 hypothetical protein GUITHDRAFT_106532 [Guillardia theta CCMP2712]